MKPASWLPAILILGLAAWSPGQDAKPQVIEEFDVARDGDALVLPGTVNGKSVHYLLDTGASGCVFDKTLLPGEPKTTLKIGSPHGPVMVECFDPPKARVGVQALSPSGLVARQDLQKMREVSGYTINAVLGMDFLRSHILQIDCDGGKVRFLKTLPADPGTPMNLTYGRDGLPCIWATIDGWVQETFLVDTGFVSAGSGDLHPVTFKGLRDSGSMQLLHSRLSLSAGGTRQVQFGQVRRFTAGEFAIASPIFSTAPRNMLGLGFLSRFVATLDLPKGVIYLRKGKRFDEPDRSDGSGVHLIRTGGKTVIHSIDKGSPAADRGLRADDVVVRIAGTPADEANLFQLRRLLSSADKQVGVTVLRGDQRIEATLVLEPAPASAKPRP